MDWLDWARAIGIWLVVLGHVVMREPFCKMFVYSFHMPLFFFLSGCTRKRASWMEHLRKDAGTLLVPYVQFSLLLFPYWLFVVAPRHPDLYDIGSWEGRFLKPFAGMFCGIGYDTPFSYSISNPLWFLVALFVVRQVFDAVDAVSGKRVAALSAILVSVSALAILISRQTENIPFSLASAGVALPFYGLGIFGRSGIARMARVPKWMMLLASGAGVGVLAFFARWNGIVDLNRMELGRSAPLFHINAILGGFSVIALSVALGKWTPKIVGILSRGSILILGMHLVVIAFWKVLAEKLLHVDSSAFSLREGLLVSWVVTLSCVPAILCVERFHPMFLGRRKIICAPQCVERP